MPLLFIIIPNIIPLIGVTLWDWDLSNIIILYWLENLVLGIYTLAKILTCQGDKKTTLGNRIFISAFFTVHYGMFCMGHAAFILSILGPYATHNFFPFQEMLDQGLITKSILTGVAVMLITQGLDFVQQYLPSKQRKTSTPQKMMFSPYRHIILIHIALLISASLASGNHQAISLLILLIIGKIALEWIIHKRTKKADSKTTTPAEKPT